MRKQLVYIGTFALTLFLSVPSAFAHEEHCQCKSAEGKLEDAKDVTTKKACTQKTAHGSTTISTATRQIPQGRWSSVSFHADLLPDACSLNSSRPQRGPLPTQSKASE